MTNYSSVMIEINIHQTADKLFSTKRKNSPIYTNTDKLLSHIYKLGERRSCCWEGCILGYSSGRSRGISLNSYRVITSQKHFSQLEYNRPRFKWKSKGTLYILARHKINCQQSWKMKRNKSAWTFNRCSLNLAATTGRGQIQWRFGASNF